MNTVIQQAEQLRKAIALFSKRLMEGAASGHDALLEGNAQIQTGLTKMQELVLQPQLRRATRLTFLVVATFGAELVTPAPIRPGSDLLLRCLSYPQQSPEQPTNFWRR